MPVEVILPKVDMDMAEGTIAVWHVREGDTVEKGAPLFDIETDKAAMEVESPASGTLHHVCAAEGAQVPIGQTVAWIYEAGEAVGEAPGGAGATACTAADAALPADTTPEEATPGEAPPAAVGTALLARIPDGTSSPQPDAGEPLTRPRATPAARTAAREAGMSLARIAGSGPRGRVQAQDVADALSARADAPAAPAVLSAQSGPLNVVRSGSATGTPHILIHGFAGDAGGWGPLEKLVALRGPVLRIELPNHGKSPRRPVGDFAALVRELRDAFDGLAEAGQGAHLIGHSLGGALALALADTRPRAVARLTLIAPAGLGPAMDTATLTGIARATKPESLAPWLRQLVGDPALITDSYARAAWAGRADPDLRSAQSAMLDALFPDGTPAFDVTAALARIGVPTRIVWGRADRVLPWQAALGAPGRVSLNLFEGVGHLPHVESTEALAGLLA